MSDRIRLDWDGLDEAERAVALLIAGISDLRPFWPRVRRIAISWISRQFDTQGAFFGDPWQPLSPAYLAWKTRVYGSSKRILSADGDLRRAATTPRSIVSPLELILRIEPYTKRTARRSSGRAGPGVGIRAGAAVSTLERGSQQVDPDWFQTGTTRMPARPLFADPPALALGELDVEAEAYVDELARAAGLTL